MSYSLPISHITLIYIYSPCETWVTNTWNLTTNATDGGSVEPKIENRATTTLPCSNQDEYRRIQRRAQMHGQLYPLPLFRSSRGLAHGIFDSCAPISDYRAEDTASAIEAHFCALTHPTHCFRCVAELLLRRSTQRPSRCCTHLIAVIALGLSEECSHDIMTLLQYTYVYIYNVIEYDWHHPFPPPKKKHSNSPSDDRSHMSPFLVRWWRWRSTPVGWWWVGGLYHPSYIGDYSSPRTGNPILNQPVYIMEW